MQYVIKCGDEILGIGPTQAAAIANLLAVHGARFETHIEGFTRQAAVENLLDNGDLEEYTIHQLAAGWYVSCNATILEEGGGPYATQADAETAVKNFK